jgi:hypothetical protein
VLDYSFIRDVKSPITEDQLRPLDPRCQVVQFSTPLTDGDCVRLAEFLRGYPGVPLRIYGHYRGAPDLTFLRHFPFLKGFQADVFDIASWEGLRFLPDSLEFLALGATRRRFSLKQVERFTHLTDLSLDGHGKDLAVLRGFTRLVYLTLRSISMPDLSLLQPLGGLRSLALKLGGTSQLGMLAGLARLRYLELWMVRGLSDLAAVAQLPELRYLFLQDLKAVRSLPSFRPLRELRRVHIENLKGLSDLAPIAEAPGLEELLVINMRHLPVERFACFREHPTLKAVAVGLGSQRRNAEAASLLGREAVTGVTPIRAYVES